ncbi:hypothetical protein RAAC3_TM7C00001G0371 [Candidatus Saccharibacteria bacterium RAAC3_TM7_1]|nr:hypothetical protein RAAC3_TM7C00001G0371 [Candidatus Saccharibacteria bacterium RAAC3_TM7_1]HCZ28825.1 hypothetical protein [Candidatus Saccharibacteria bacterium]
MNKAINIQQHKGRRALIISLVVLVALIAFDISPFGGNARFYATWIGCGDKPVATEGSGYLNSGAIHYYEPSSFPGLHPTIEYFCTPLEAEKAGYSASPNQYEFPHLQQGI